MPSESRVRRFAVIGVVLFCAAVLGGFLLRSWFEHRNVRKFTLRDGTEIRVEGVTWGTNKLLPAPPLLWRQVASRIPDAWLPSRWRSPAYRSDTIGFRQAWGGGAHVWMRRYDPMRDVYLDCNVGELLTFDSAGVPARRAGIAGIDQIRASEATEFELMDWRQDTLRFQLRVGGDRHDFELPNPRLGERFPEWPALPLPQSVARGPYELTLSKVKRIKGGDVRWSPQVAIARGGADVTRWFNQVRQFVDPTGNRHWERLPSSETVWGIEVTAIPSAIFPFDDSAAIRLGSVTVPPPGKLAVIPKGTTSTNDIVQWAVVKGCGSFEFHKGTNTSASPDYIDRGSSSRPSRTSTFVLDSAHPALGIVLWLPPTEPKKFTNASVGRQHIVIRGRRPDGTVIQGDARDSSLSGDSQAGTVLMMFHFEQARPGETLELDLFFVEPIYAKLTFAAPRTE
jgi:hypothetical protein